MPLKGVNWRVREFIHLESAQPKLDIRGRISTHDNPRWVGSPPIESKAQPPPFCGLADGRGRRIRLTNLPHNAEMARFPETITHPEIPQSVLSGPKWYRIPISGEHHGLQTERERTYQYGGRAGRYA